MFKLKVNMNGDVQRIKLFKIKIVFLMVCCLLFSTSTFAFAAEKNDVNVINEPKIITPIITPNGADADLFRYRVKNVNVDLYWGGFNRVSDNMITGSAGGAITSTQSLTFNASVTGSIFGYPIIVGSSLTSTMGYRLDVPANSRVYLGYRVYYRSEEGLKEKYNYITGTVVQSNYYHVTSPQYGEFKLVNY